MTVCGKSRKRVGMDDDSRDALKTGLEIVLRPVTDIASDVLGIAGGLWLHEQHERIRASLRARTAEILKERKVDAPETPPPSIMVPLLAAAQNESREELVGLWAKLLATAMDPQRSGLYRREFVPIAAQIEPLEAVLLPLLNHPTDLSPNRVDYFRDQLNKSWPAGYFVPA